MYYQNIYDVLSIFFASLLSIDSFTLLKSTHCALTYLLSSKLLCNFLAINQQPGQW